MSIEELYAELGAVQKKIVEALQEEYLCGDDLVPPAESWGWDQERLRNFFESFGSSEKGADKEAPVIEGQPGGGRELPEPAAMMPVCRTDGEAYDDLVNSVSYGAAVIAYGLPLYERGLFEPGDKVLQKLVDDGYKPFVKHLPVQCVDEKWVWCPSSGWAAGSTSVENGMDLRLFVRDDKKHKEIRGALRYSSRAKIGQALATVHGGAVETALDEATAECCKTKMFPMCATAQIEFQIAQAVQPMRTYLVVCSVEQEGLQNGKRCVVLGTIYDPELPERRQKIALATAEMVDIKKT